MTACQVYLLVTLIGSTQIQLALMLSLCAELPLNHPVNADLLLLTLWPPWYQSLPCLDLSCRRVRRLLLTLFYVLQPAVNETVASIAYSDEWRALEEHLSEVDKL